MKPDIWDRYPGGMSERCLGNGKIYIDRDPDGNILIDDGDKILGVMSITDFNRLFPDLKYLRLV